MEKRRGISGSTLKIIAMAAMILDHVAAGVLGRYLVMEGMNEAADLSQGITEHDTLVVAYQMMRIIGRLAFPIFCFLLVEGFTHTSSKAGYAIRLLAFAVISEVPFDLMFSGKVLEFTYQNVFFTLFIGLMVMWGCNLIEVRKMNPMLSILLEFVVVFAGMMTAQICFTDYGSLGVLCIMALYIFRSNKKFQMVAGVVSFLWEMPAPLGFIPIGFYNGERGLKMKYLFYIFYPAHLLIIYLICMALGITSYLPG